MASKLWDWFLCNVMKDHDWTCNAKQGIKPTPLQQKNGIAGFKDYAKIYCKRCGTFSTLQL